jgi:hypothetical protein
MTSQLRLPAGRGARIVGCWSSSSTLRAHNPTLGGQRKHGEYMATARIMVTGPEISLLLRMIDEAYEKKTWHGPNLRGSIRGLEARKAAWRPGPNRHNIWEIVVHAAYWKYAVRRRILGEKRGSFPVKGSNWFIRPTSLTEEAWRDDIALLQDMHRKMRAAVAGFSLRDLEKIPRGSKVSNVCIIYGIALHDVYHAGQIQLLKRLVGQNLGQA